MDNSSLDRVLAVNEQLAALAKVGVPLELGLEQPGISTATVLEQINASLALRVGRGQSASDVLAEDDDLPPSYRAAMQTGLLGNNLAAALEGVSYRAVAMDGLRSTVGYSLVQPLIVLTLVYFGFVYLCLFVAPTFEGIYQQLYREPSASVALLASGRKWMPYWAPLLPLLLVVGVMLWRRGSRRNTAWIGTLRRWRWVPGTSRYFAAVRHANFAGQLALLLENDVPLADGLPLAAAATGDLATIAAAKAIADANQRGERLSPDRRELQTLPPMLRWALAGDLGDEPLSPILRFAAKTYSESARRRAAIWSIAAPALLGSVLGGVFVLIYGLSIFVPMIQLLQDLSMPAT